MFRNTMAIAILALATAATAAHADNGFYVGGGGGQMMVDEGVYDDEDTAYSMFGGYQFNRHWAIEGGYASLGKIAPNVAGLPLDADTFYVTAVGVLPISDRFSFYGKAGMHRWDADHALVELGNEDNGSDLTYGVGAQYRFNKRFALRTEVSRFEMEDIDAHAFLLQARFDF